MGTACTMHSPELCVGELSKIFRLLTAYAAVKYSDVLIDPYSMLSHHALEDHVRNANTLIVHALRIGTWGSDFHLFPLSLLLDRPIFMYVFFLALMKTV